MFRTNHIPIKCSGTNLINVNLRSQKSNVPDQIIQKSNVPEQISSQSFPYNKTEMFRNKSQHNHLHKTRIKCPGTHFITIISISQNSNVPEQISSQSFADHKYEMIRNPSHHNHLHITKMRCFGTNLVTIISIFQI